MNLIRNQWDWEEINEFNKKSTNLIMELRPNFLYDGINFRIRNNWLTKKSINLIRINEFNEKSTNLIRTRRI